MKIILFPLVNKCRLVVIGILIAFTLSFKTYAQNLHFKPPKQKAFNEYNEGLLKLKQLRLIEAEGFFDDAVKIDTNFAKAWLELGNITFRLRKYNKAGDAYKHFLRLNPDVENQALVAKIALLLGDLGDYAGAETAWKNYLESPNLLETQRLDAKAKLDNLTTIKEGIANPLAVNLRRLPSQANRIKYSYFPVIAPNGRDLYFTGRTGLEGSGSDENLYLVTKTGEKWSRAMPLPGYVNTLNQEGTCTISADGNTIIFAACDNVSRVTLGSCDLYQSIKVNGLWQEAENLERINSPNYDVQPSLSADGNTLYFVSDRHGGKGGTDIWYSIKDSKNEWQEPKLVGGEINTPALENAPFIHPNNQNLIFSSTGHGGYGKHDIFVSDIKNGVCTDVRNAGYPLSTSADESSLTVSADGLKGYISRDSSNNTSVLSSYLSDFDVPEAFKIKAKTVLLYGVCKDVVGGIGVNSKIVVQSFNGADTIYHGKTDAFGKFVAVIPIAGNYTVLAEANGYFPANQLVDAAVAVTEAKPLIINLRKAVKGATLNLPNIYFQSGSAELLDDSKATLNAVVSFIAKQKAQSSFKLLIEGHTDDIGTAESNLKLSTDRALAVASYFEAKGITPALLKTIGLGESQPAASGITEAARKANRRIVIKIL